MALEITVEVEDERPPPVGTSLRVEARDVYLADAPALLLDAVDMRVEAATPGMACVIARATLGLERVPEMGTVWVHCDVDGDGRVSIGDFITMQSYPIPPGGSGSITVRVRRV
jgi:hypothetical protein